MSNLIPKVKEAISGLTADKSRAHDGNNVNVADPRVDSNRDHRSNHSSTIGMHGAQGLYPSGLMQTGHGKSSVAPHKSNLMNKMDPRVDTTLDGHAARVTENSNAVTPGKVDAHLDGHGARATHNPNTVNPDKCVASTLAAGPEGVGNGSGSSYSKKGLHSTHFMTKADPRVDSDHVQQANRNNASQARDPVDAAQVPPSVLAQHVGEKVVKHDAHPDDHTRRHSKTTSQSLQEYGAGTL